ncbi:MAG: ParB/RepB/Spo0J family partition protein [Bdellovibrionota bacterium]
MRSFWFFLILLSATHALEATCREEIRRVKNPTALGLKFGIVEFPIDQIVYIHEVPNPKREDHGPDFMEELMKKIEVEGFQEKFAVPLLKMPNGSFLCMGHHRTEAMKRLGETTVPALIYTWSELSPRTRELLLELHPSLLTPYLDP